MSPICLQGSLVPPRCASWRPQKYSPACQVGFVQICLLKVLILQWDVQPWKFKAFCVLSIGGWGDLKVHVSLEMLSNPKEQYLNIKFESLFSQLAQNAI